MRRNGLEALGSVVGSLLEVRENKPIGSTDESVREKPSRVGKLFHPVEQGPVREKVWKGSGGRKYLFEQKLTWEIDDSQGCVFEKVRREKTVLKSEG